MHDLMLWHDDDERPSKVPTQPAAPSSLPPTFDPGPRPSTIPSYDIVWFTDIWDRRTIRKGRVLRTITVPDRCAKTHAHPATIVLELVAYTDDQSQEQLDVIWPDRHAQPKAPTI